MANMSAAILGAAMVLPKNGLNVDAIKRSLTFRQKQTSSIAEQQTLYGFIEQEDVLIVPRQYALKQDLAAGRSIVDETPAIEPAEGATMMLPHGLREHQQAAKDAIMKEFNENAQHGSGCIVSLPCGFGKTVLALNVAATLGLKCAIVVHTTMLAEQWKSAIQQYVHGAEIGSVRQNTFDVKGKTHVICSLHSVSKRDYDWQNAGIALVIIDEAHHAAALQLSRALFKIPSKFRLGLSATLTRADGLTPFLYAGIGAPVYSIDREANPDLRVFCIKLDAGPMRDKTLWNGTTNVPGMLTQLTDTASTAAVSRQQAAATWIRYCIAKGRQILVVADRVQLLLNLKELLHPLHVGVIIGAVKAAAREEAREADVILGTYAIIAEGFDVPSLDTILFLTPRRGKSVIIQSVGRILRSGGKTPVIIDFVDHNSVFQNMWKSRAVYYRKMGARFTFYDQRKKKLD